MADELFQATSTFAVVEDDQHIVVHKGDLVRAGHPILKGRAKLFKPAENVVRFEVEQATKAPGEKRGTRSRRSKADA